MCLSHSYFSDKWRPRAFGSSRGVIFLSSISSARPSGKGWAFMYRRLCLLGDLDRHMTDDSSVTVSRYDTTGSDLTMGTQAWSSSRSFKQISKCNSPAPAIMCSPDSSEKIWTIGSDLDRRLRPSTSLGRSAGFLQRTATRTTGETENFICLMLWAWSQVEMQPVLTKYWSTPTRPTKLPAGTSSMASM